jgi:hypothetical protein
MKIYGPDGSVQMTQTTETLELNHDVLAASLFDIPQSYKLAASSQDLYSVTMPVSDENDNGQNSRPGNRGIIPPAVVKTVSLNVSMASGTSNQSDIESYVRSKMSDRGYRVVSGPADYAVNLQFNQLKESTASKVGGIFGKVTGVPTGSTGKVDIDLVATLSGKARGTAKIKDKFDGPLSAAVRLALDQAVNQLFENLDR